MRRKMIAILLAVLLLASAVLCVGAALYSDTEGHWAESYINEATSRGLFSGVEDGSRFAPDDEMTRGMFVTVLGRLAGIDPADYDTAYLATVFDDIKTDAYYAPYVSWAVTVGVASGIGDNLFAPDQAVSREQMACFVSNYLTVAGYDLSVPARRPGELPAEFERPEFVPTPREDINGDDLVLPPDTFDDEDDIILPPDDFDDDDDEPYFSDDDQIAGWAKNSVSQMQKIGLLAGAPDGNGGFAFLPKKVATRAECAVLFVKQQDYMAGMTPEQRIEAVNLVINCDSTEVEAGASVQLSAVVFPMEAEQRVFWYSTDREVLTVDAAGCVTGVAEGEAEVHARMTNGQEVCCSVNVLPAPEPDYLAPPQVDAPQSWYDKCMRIFGTVYEDPRLAYSGNEEASPHMTVIVVPAWDIDENGEKYSRQFYLQVHENVADIVQCIFEEIYALPEQVPIHSLGGYRWDGKCEHSIGLAIDINPAENYYCKNDGTAVVGKYFKPGEDPYSIPVEGAVDQIFAKYGFTRGIYWHCGYKDYMHYSYFGT